MKHSSTQKLKPRIFVGSSVESIKIANTIQLLLEHDAEVTVWSQGIFEPSSSALDDLIEKLPNFDFGVFIFSPDDIAKIRKKQYMVTRDNVIFEMGLFVGRLGKKRTLYVVPRGVDKFHLPSDLIGVSPLDYDSNRSDGNLKGALGSVCTKIIEQTNKLGRVEIKVSNDSPTIEIISSIFTPQEEVDFTYIHSKLNNLFEAKCHVVPPKETTTEKPLIQEKGCLFKYSFLDLLAKNILSGAIELNQFFLRTIKFEEYESFKEYIDQGYKFSSGHIQTGTEGVLTSLGILTPQIRTESVSSFGNRIGSRERYVYKFSEKSFRFVLWLDYYKKIKDVPEVEFIKFLKSAH